MFASCLQTILVVLSLASSMETSELPVEAFASLPNVSQVSLSPDGNKVALLYWAQQLEDQETFVRVINLQTGESQFPFKTDNQSGLINRLRWGNDSILLASISMPATRQGVPTTETRIVRLDLEAGSASNLLSTSFLRRFRYTPQFQTNIVDMLPDDPDHILIALDGYRDHTGVSIFQVNLQLKRPRVIENGQGYISNWLTDQQHQIRIGVYQRDTNFRVLERSPERRNQRLLWQFELFSEDEVWPLGFGKDPNQLYVIQYHQGRKALFVVDLTDPELTAKPVITHPHYDVQGSLLYSDVEKDVIGVTFNEGGGFTFFEESYQRLQKAIDRALPETTNLLLGFSKDERRYVLFSSNATDPGAYFVGDRDTGELLHLADRFTMLPVDYMQPKQRIQYQARDGLTIEGFLTQPSTASKSSPPPAIIFPHGGPISFDDGSFDYWTQFFANRGFAVLQMNFRGSAGYGFDFMSAGIQGWGQAMQDDIEDGTRWMIQQGYADPDRICIVGASYGGYAALMGSIKTPELYRCAVSFAGVTDVELLVRSHRRYRNSRVAQAQIGDNFRELRSISPVNLVEHIQIPLLIIHGDQDRSVDIQQGRRLIRQLERHNKDVRYIELERGDHYLSNSQHRLTAFRAMNEFLKQHLTQQPESAHADQVTLPPSQTPPN